MKPNGLDLPFNTAESRVMHIDLNSCFAIIEQQSNRLLRGKPVGVAAYDTPRGFVLAASYEAKVKNIKLGVNVAEARQLCPEVIILTPDPSKYREAHRRFKELMHEFTDDVSPKSIDEFVLHMDGSPKIRAGLSMEAIGLEVKDKVRERLGEAVTVNVGIGPNRFLAKFAAGFNKPDGMKHLNHLNFERTLEGMDLMDLPGINVGYKQRLNQFGIFTPADFFKADRRLLEKVVFRSINGYYWYLRLRGYEIDKHESKRTQIGHQYALPHKTADREELARLLLKLCEKVGRRLRKLEMTAGGIHLYLSFINYQKVFQRENGFIGGENMASGRSWHQGQKVGFRLYSTESIYRVTKNLLQKAEIHSKARGISITVFDLRAARPEQLSLLEAERDFASNRNISDALDAINTRYGEFVITPATMMDMRGEILDRIAFGSVKDF